MTNTKVNLKSFCYHIEEISLSRWRWFATFENVTVTEYSLWMYIYFLIFEINKTYLKYYAIYYFFIKLKTNRF